MDEWIKRFPREPGWYWFYGYPWGNKSKYDKPRLEIMEIIVITGNSLVGSISNTFIYQKECEGWFLKTDEPSTEGLHI